MKESPDFTHLVKIDYDIDLDHDLTECAGTSRCSQILNPRISQVDVKGIVKEYLNYLPTRSRTRIADYCVDRLVRYNGIYSGSNWKVNVLEFYYGEEIVGSQFLRHEKLVDEIQKLIELTPGKQVEYVLVKEFKYLIEPVANKSWKVKTVPYSSIEVGNTFHFSQLDKESVEAYKSHNFPRCIVVPKGKKYRLIDGYHRYTAAKGMSKIKVIVGKDQLPEGDI